MNTVKSIKLLCQDGHSDKEYNIFLNKDPISGDYKVDVAYGRRGNAINTGTKTQSPVALYVASREFDKLVNEKLAKGYVVSSNSASPVVINTTESEEPVDEPTEDKPAVRRSPKIFPQLLNPISEEEATIYIENKEWLAQEKLDGKRIIIKVDEGEVYATNRRGVSCAIPQKVEEALSKMVNAILDGELVNGKYIIFDGLELYRDNLKNLGVENRFNTITKAVKERILLANPEAPIGIVECAISSKEKQALYDSLKTKEGVVFKLKNSPYTAGRPASGGSQLKCKFWSSATVQVLNINDKRSVEVGIASSKPGLLSIGNVSVPPNYELPKIGDLVEVKYLYYFPGGSLFQPQYLGIRDDAEVDHLDTLKPKTGEEE